MHCNCQRMSMRYSNTTFCDATLTTKSNHCYSADKSKWNSM